jgi:hypothetical protein
MDLELIKTLIYFLTGGFLIFLAITITRDNFSNRVNRITGGLLFFAGFGPIAMAIGSIMHRGAVEGVPVEQLPLYNLYLIWEFFFPTLLAFSWHFPTERLRAYSKSRLVYLILVPQFMHILLVVFFQDLVNLSDTLTSAAAEGGFLSLILGPLSFVV